MSVLLTCYLHGKYLTKRNEELSGILTIWEEVISRKKRTWRLFQRGIYIFTIFLSCEALDTHVFIYYSCSECHYGLSTLFDFKPTKIKRETKTVPAHPALNWIAVWEMAKYNWTTARQRHSPCRLTLLRQPEGPWPNISVGRGASGEVEFYPSSLWRPEFIRFQSLLPLLH